MQVLFYFVHSAAAKSRREAVMAAESETEFTETEFTQSQQNKTLIFKNGRNQVLGSYKFKTQQVRHSQRKREFSKNYFLTSVTHQN